MTYQLRLLRQIVATRILTIRITNKATNFPRTSLLRPLLRPLHHPPCPRRSFPPTPSTLPVPPLLPFLLLLASISLHRTCSTSILLLRRGHRLRHHPHCRQRTTAFWIVQSPRMRRTALKTMPHDPTAALPAAEASRWRRVWCSTCVRTPMSDLTPVLSAVGPSSRRSS